MSTPIVAVVGRPNVGKSTFFNRIVGQRLAIVNDSPGITRDRLYSKAEWLGHEFRVIDTGGIDLENTPINTEIRAQATLAIDEADVILFIVSKKEGVTDSDKEVAKILYQTDKPVMLVVNKVDNPESRQEIFDFYSLGLGDPIPVSSTHGLGTGDLLDKLIQLFPESISEDEDDAIRFSLIGRPNVGKSSLVNSLIGENRVIVSDVAGTTRDAIDTRFTTNDGQEFVMVDTAGIRKRGKVYESTEKYAVLRAMRAIDESDVVLIVINAEEGIKEQDKHIAGFAQDAGKGVIFVVNKWDLIQKDNSTLQEFENTIRNEFQFMTYAPIVFVSAVTKQRLNKLPQLIQDVSENQEKRIASSVFNELLLDAIALNPAPTDNGKRLRVYYGTQVAIKPPTFVIFVNDPDIMHFSYQRYLENQIRQNFDFSGTSIKLIIRERK